MYPMAAQKGAEAATAAKREIGMPKHRSVT
jgi:hypothetical protein